MPNKMEAKKTLQVECNFDIIGIIEAHLNISVSDNVLQSKCKEMQSWWMRGLF